MLLSGLLEIIFRKMSEQDDGCRSSFDLMDILPEIVIAGNDGRWEQVVEQVKVEDPFWDPRFVQVISVLSFLF